MASMAGAPLFASSFGTSGSASPSTHQQQQIANANASLINGPDPAALDPFTMVPVLSQHLHESFGGPHTQFACSCFYGHQNGSLVPCQLVMSCTQLFLCDADSYVIRVALINRLLAVYRREVPVSTSAVQGGGAGGRPEQELLLVFDREHDLLLRGALTCDGTPPKPLLQTLLALQKVHCPTSPVALHMNSAVPLKDVAKLKPPGGYVAPLPQREEDWELCPCWRAADVLNISDEEFAARLRNLCIVYCPEKLPNVPELCRKYSRKKGGVLQHMVQQYGPEPTEEHAMAVYKVLHREEKFADILRSAAAVLPSRRNAGFIQTADFTGTAVTSSGTAGGGHQVPLSALFGAKKALKDSLFSQADSLHYPVLKLLNQPSGGFGRIHLKVKPVPFVQVQQDVVSKYAHRLDDPQHEFWYMTNEGFVLPFDISPEVMAAFGFEHGDRVLATWGVTRGRWSTVVGVRDGTLWVQDDGDVGACALIGFTCRDELERCNGWIKQERVSCPMRETSAMQIAILPDLSPRAVIISPDIVYPRCGFYHGEVVRCSEACSIPFDGIAIIAGVDAEDEHTLYAFFVDPSDEGLTQEALIAQQLKHLRKAQAKRDARDKESATMSSAKGKPLMSSRAGAQALVRCMNADDVRAAYGWKSVGAARILHYQPGRVSSIIL